MNNKQQRAEIAQLVKEGRVGKGYTQQELSEAVGISLRSIQRIENAEVSPRLYTLGVLSRHLGFSHRISPDSNPSHQNMPTPPSIQKAVSFTRSGTRLFNYKQKIILSIGIGIILALLLAAFLAQSSGFPETGFEFLLLLVVVICFYMLTLLVIWR